MTPDFVFNSANAAALLGWAVLAYGALRRQAFAYHTLAGLAWPVGLAAAYSGLILFFFGRAEGGFDSLAHVQQLFAAPWLLVAGWIHYLAFDLFIGAWIVRQVLALGLPRLVLVVLLPLTFMFGPMGLLGFHVARLALANPEHAS